MSAPPQEKGAPIECKAQLVEYLEAGCKAADDWRIGTEHEKFAFDQQTLKPLPYEDPTGGAKSIRRILEALAERFGWSAIAENGKPIALTKNGCNITLEPGGQVELSGAPLETIHQTCDEVHTHLHQVKEICGPVGVGMIGLGFAPTWTRADMPWMPKNRYEIMKSYMPKRGKLGLDMMLRSCTVQTNLDFASESDMVRKFRVSLALQPVATALFANSPFVEGRPSGFLSYRSHIWTDTDPDRTGVPQFVFEDGMSFERYVDYALDVPMYFVYREGRYLDASGQSFRDFMAGRLPALPGETPSESDWADHLTTLFPEVRLKRFLEMRGADGGPWKRLCALPALWVGLLYDADSLTAAEELIAGWTAEDHQRLRDEVPRLGLATEAPGGGVLRDLAQRMLDASAQGLKSRERLDSAGESEVHFLNTLREIVESGLSPAERKLETYRGRWNGDLAPLFREFEY
ncbi:glutamate--cysteine ligase [Algihabitans albus]|uniref:glutamate--cysteine ligase n=1 Tax=Algihabitans albus TaxID=2164067 RepID=UPI000E5C9F68|nr:glutamate--cysteine ligase [Algihabitans albus]